MRFQVRGLWPVRLRALVDSRSGTRSATAPRDGDQIRLLERVQIMRLLERVRIRVRCRAEASPSQNTNGNVGCARTPLWGKAAHRIRSRRMSHNDRKRFKGRTRYSSPQQQDLSRRRKVFGREVNQIGAAGSHGEDSS